MHVQTIKTAIFQKKKPLKDYNLCNGVKIIIAISEIVTSTRNPWIMQILGPEKIHVIQIRIIEGFLTCYSRNWHYLKDCIIKNHVIQDCVIHCLANSCRFAKIGRIGIAS